MNYYLIDASAFVYAVENVNRTKIDFFMEKAEGTAFLYVPQFCVAEVLNTYARLFFRENRIAGKLYTEWRNEFLKAIRSRRTLYCYDLHRYHNLNADRIYRKEHRMPYQGNENSLSAFDILIIAMGMELKKIHSPNEVTILTRDIRLRTISNSSGEFVPAIWFE